MTLLSAVLGLALGRGAGTAWLVAAVLAGQLAVGWSNDYLDRGSDYAAKRSDKPLATGALSPATVRTSALVAGAAAAALSLANGVPAALVHFIALACALAYNAGLKATPVSPVPFAAAFGLLPSFASLGNAGHPWPPVWLTVAAAMIGVAGHFTQVLPDIAQDRVQGSRGLPQLIGAAPSAAIAAGLLLAAVAAASLAAGVRGPQLYGALIVAGGLCAAIVIAALGTRKRLAFWLTLALATAAALAILRPGTPP